MECMALQHGERPEVQWLKEKYQEFMRREGIGGKEEADKCIYRRMYGKEPVKQQDILKIRYWRTGRHLPVNHGQCISFGRALGLDGADLRYLLQGYYDGCDEIYQEESPDMQSVYWKRRNAMQRLGGRISAEDAPGPPGADEHHPQHSGAQHTASVLHGRPELYLQGDVGMVPDKPHHQHEL